MNDAEFINHITRDRSDFLGEILGILDDRRIAYCVIGGLAVNAYAEPVVSLDLDLVIVADVLEDLVAALEGRFKIARFPHSVNVTSAESDLRVQLQIDARYQVFLGRSERKNVLGRDLLVAAMEDVLQGKVWAFQDPEGDRASARRIWPIFFG